MADDSSLVQNATVKDDENVDKFPYRILNDLSKKLKVAEATIASLLAICESNPSNQNYLVMLVTRLSMQCLMKPLKM